MLIFRAMIQPDTLAAAYELLRTMAPFRGWHLPPADEVEFRVTRDRTEHGHYNRYSGTDHHWIAISEANTGHTGNLLMWMAHEIVHLYQGINKLETKNTTHNADFRRRAARICRLHGWDPKLFV